MALELTTDKPEFIDPFNGLQDLAARILRTPVRAGDSFNDDPLRMMRAARFASQLEFEIAPEVLASMKDLAHRISIISAERVRDEFVKIIMSPNPRIGITLLVDTGLADIVLPEIPKLRLEVDEHHHHKDVYEHSITVLEQAIALEERLGGPILENQRPVPLLKVAESHFITTKLSVHVWQKSVYKRCALIMKPLTQSSY
jgi:poly(A) polymerase